MDKHPQTYTNAKLLLLFHKSIVSYTVALSSNRLTHTGPAFVNARRYAQSDTSGEKAFHCLFSFFQIALFKLDAKSECKNRKMWESNTLHRLDHIRFYSGDLVLYLGLMQSPKTKKQN